MIRKEWKLYNLPIPHEYYLQTTSESELVKMKVLHLLSIVLGVLPQLAFAAPKLVENEARKATDRLVFAHFMVFPSSVY